MRQMRSVTMMRNLNVLIALITSLSMMCDAYLVCEELPVELCAFAVSTIGARCVLEGEKLKDNDGVEYEEYKCQTSTLMVAKSKNGAWIETDDCIEACGLNRMSVGISTDALADNKALSKLCSHRCKESCPDLFELHNELAAAEKSNSSLGDLCMGIRRLMGEFGGFGGNGHVGKDPDCGGFACGGGGGGGGRRGGGGGRGRGRGRGGGDGRRRGGGGGGCGGGFTFNPLIPIDPCIEAQPPTLAFAPNPSSSEVPPPTLSFAPSISPSEAQPPTSTFAPSISPIAN